MPVRKANAVWEGSLKEGQGTVKLGSGAYEGRYSFGSRFEEAGGTNPEELIGAAHAGCFSMALSAGLGRSGFTPTRVATSAKVHLEKVGEGFKITRIELDNESSVPNVDDATFQDHARKAKEGCPVSQALGGVEITLNARLVRAPKYSQESISSLTSFRRAHTLPLITPHCLFEEGEVMVWKKSDDPPAHHPEPSVPPRPAATSAPAPSPTPAAASEQPRRTGDRATIGPSIFIKGDLTGEEDLVIEGRVEGKVDLKQNNVTVGKNGRVKADIFGRVVTIEGEVDGNVFAREQAILRQSGAIRGNITAPRVILEDGSRFKGSIDMEPPKENAGAGSYSRQQDRDRDRSSDQREQNRPEAVGAKANAG